MKVVLLETVKKLGTAGTVIEAKQGYAINYLIPNGLAEVATAQAIEKAELLKEQERKWLENANSKLEEFADSIAGKTYKIPAQVSSGGRIYGSLAKEEIMESLVKAWKLSPMDKERISIDINLPKSIRQVGKYTLEAVIGVGERVIRKNIILDIVSKD